MVDYVWPIDLAPRSVMFDLLPSTQRSRSPFTRAEKVYQVAAALWVCRMTFRVGDWGERDDDVAAWLWRLQAWKAKLRGGANRVQLWDFRREAARALQPRALPDPLETVGAAAGAATMAITGFAPHALAFREGDYLGGDGRPHIVLETIHADENGGASPLFEPPLIAAVPPGNAVVRRVPGWFRLAADDSGQAETEVGQPTEVTLDFVEDAWWG